MKLPHKFGKYVLVSKIAQGGMAEIYRAKYLGEGDFVKDVAVKRILPVFSDNKEFITMLCDEAKALVHLQHQNIVQVYELGKDSDAFYISMEYVEGVDLRQVFKRVVSPPPSPSPIKGEGKGRGGPEPRRMAGPRPPELGGDGAPPLHDTATPTKFISYITGEVLKALDFAHNRKDRHGKPLGIIHRDISPQNILISFNGEVKVVDFGIAKGAHRSHETTVASIKGKYAYMSPEQAFGQPVDARTDLYAVGIVLFEFLTGQRLYDAPNDMMTIEQVKRGILPEGWERNVPIGARPIMRKALEHDVSKRYQSAAEFLEDINRYVVANKLITHGHELAVYLRELFHEEYQRAQKEEVIDIEGIEDLEPRPQTQVLSRVTNIDKGMRWRRYRWYAVAAASVTVIALSVGGLIWKSAIPPSPSLLPLGERVASEENPSLPSLPTPPLLKGGEGGLSPPISILNIQARPWGYVYIPGHVEKKETPVRGIKLQPGDYQIKVYYEPEDKWLEKKVILAAGASLTCIANFEGVAEIKCR